MNNTELKKIHILFVNGELTSTIQGVTNWSILRFPTRQSQNQYSYFVLRIKLAYNFPYINPYVMIFLCEYVILIRLKSTRQCRLSINDVFASLVFVTTSPLKGLPSQFRKTESLQKIRPCETQVVILQLKSCNPLTSAQLLKCMNAYTKQFSRIT